MLIKTSFLIRFIFWCIVNFAYFLHFMQTKWRHLPILKNSGQLENETRYQKDFDKSLHHSIVLSAGINKIFTPDHLWVNSCIGLKLSLSATQNQKLPQGQQAAALPSLHNGFFYCDFPINLASIPKSFSVLACSSIKLDKGKIIAIKNYCQ